MPARYWVRVTRHAEESITDIVVYIARELYAPGAAWRIRTMLRRAIHNLNEMPARVPLTPEEPWRSKGIRRMVVGDYYVCLWIEEACHVVHVTDVISVRVNQIPRLEIMPLE